MPRISSPADNPAFAEGEPSKDLQHDHAARQQTDDGAESLALARLHLLELFKLIRIEEHRMRIERAQHPGNRALIDRGFGGYGIGGFAFYRGVNTDDLLQLLFDLRCRIIRGRQGPRINAQERE